MARKTDNVGTSIFIRNVPKHVKSHFKGFCARRGISMNWAIAEFMRRCVEAEQRRDILTERVFNRAADYLCDRKASKEGASGAEGPQSQRQ